MTLCLSSQKTCSIKTTCMPTETKLTKYILPKSNEDMLLCMPTSTKNHTNYWFKIWKDLASHGNKFLNSSHVAPEDPAASADVDNLAYCLE